MVYYAIAIAFSNGILSDKNIFFIKKKKKKEQEQTTETGYNIFLLWNILFVLMV